MEFVQINDNEVMLCETFSVGLMSKGIMNINGYVSLCPSKEYFFPSIFTLNNHSINSNECTVKEMVEQSNLHSKIYMYFITKRGTGPWYLPVGDIVGSRLKYDELSEYIETFRDKKCSDTPIEKRYLIPVTPENITRCLEVKLANVKWVEDMFFGVNFYGKEVSPAVEKGIFHINSYSGNNILFGKIFPYNELFSIVTNIYNIQYRGFLEYLHDNGYDSYLKIKDRKIRGLFEKVLASNDIKDEQVKYILGEVDYFPGRIKIDYSHTLYSKYLEKWRD